MFMLWLILIGCVVRGQPLEGRRDQIMCSPQSTPLSTGKPLPIFPNQAQFIMETIASMPTNVNPGPSTVTISQYFYDYDANTMVLKKNQQGFIELEYYYYDRLKKTTYFPQKHCVVTDIPVNIDDDGGSAFQLPNGGYHIRPLSEFIQFSSPNAQKPILPIYIGPGTFRDIAVDQWELCLFDEKTKRNDHRIWYFVQSEFQTSLGSVSNISIPLGYVTNSSIATDDGSINLQFDEITNIYSFKPQIIESSDFFVPPKGIFCPNFASLLANLSDLGIQWPVRYSVRIHSTTSRGIRENPLRLIVDNNLETKRARFDYKTDNKDNYKTVILDYQENIKYVIDKIDGSCDIVQGIDWNNFNPEWKPAHFFFKLKETMLDQPPKNAWQYRGIRPCRGLTMHCAIFTTLMNNYPEIVDPVTGSLIGQSWNETHIEYAWSQRDPGITASPNNPTMFDYPVSLFLRTYQILEDSLGTVEYRSEEIEYEFYEMSTDLSIDSFDVSVCYRSLDLPYSHLGFALKSEQANLVDSNHLDRKVLHDRVLSALQTAMKPIKLTRIHQLEIDHGVNTTFDTLFIMFLLLSPAPTTNLSTDQPSIEVAREQLRNTINSGNFNINIQLVDDSGSNIIFKGVPDSLQHARDFLSSNALIFNLANQTVSEIHVINMTNTIVQNIVVYNDKTEWRWSSKAQTVGIVVGLLIGVVVGIIIALVIHLVFKDPSPQSLTMIPMTSISNVNYDAKRQMLSTSAKTGTTSVTSNSSNA